MKIISNILILSIKSYKVLISPLFGERCCYYPTCSEYGITAIKKYGAFNGTYLTIKRVIRCHPWSKSGIDHVP